MVYQGRDSFLTVGMVKLTSTLPDTFITGRNRILKSVFR